MKLYFLKCIRKEKGNSVLRGLCVEPPLSEASWVQKWREKKEDLDFERFVGDSLVPKWNPFSTIDGNDYSEARTVVLEVMNSTSIAKLKEHANIIKDHSPEQQKRDIAALLMALCQEPGLLAALDEEGRYPQWRKPLQDFLQEDSDLPVTPPQRMLLRIFAGDDSCISRLPEVYRQAMAPFSVKGKKMDDLLRWRVLGHLASALIAAPDSSVLSALTMVMLSPEELARGEPCFLPGMDEDIRKRVMKALLERGENIWKFKSHWYKCACCGYTFFIGECGRPMETTKCPECNRAIGGAEHQKTDSTKEDDETDKSPQGYCLPPAEKDEKHITFRDISSSSARSIRLLLHGALYCGLAAHLPAEEAPNQDEPMPRIYSRLVNEDSQCSMPQGNEAEYISAHFLNDYHQMVELMSSNVEDLSATLHECIGKMGSQNRDTPKGSHADTNWSKLNLELRNQWEESIDRNYLATMTTDYADSLTGLFNKWKDSEEDGKFVSELMETADVSGFPIQKRKAEMPQIWAYRSAVTLDALHARLGQERQAAKLYPVLQTTLQHPNFPVLEALGLLVGVFEWHQLVASHFSGRISRDQAKRKTIQEAIDEFPPADQEKWIRAFGAFEKAWRISWPYIERHECLEIPEPLKTFMIDKTSALEFGISDPEGVGICPTALTQWLVARHNEIVQVVAGTYRVEGRKVSSRLLSQHDAIKVEGDEIMRFLKSRCVTYGGGGKLTFDLELLERQLRRQMNRPEIVVELRAFQWVGESFSQSSELKNVMKQRELPNDVADRIKSELTNTIYANICHEKVSMCVNFILKAGGAGLSQERSGEMLLSEYLRSVLCETGFEMPSSTVRAEVRLHHIDAFMKLLRSVMNKDPMDRVDSRYKADLTEDLESSLHKVKDDLPSMLLEVLGSCAETHLVDATGAGPETALMDTLEVYLETEGSDKAVIDSLKTGPNALPGDLKMKHWVALYRLLEKS